MTAEGAPPPLSPVAWLITLWGAGGVAAILMAAVWRLAPIAVDALSYELSWAHGLAYAASVITMGYTEGYRAFQLSYSPRVVARAFHLARAGFCPRWLLAPLYCMGLLGSNQRRLLISWAVLIAITLLVVIVKQTPQPWRGIVDAGVVVGLSWGTLAIAVYWFRAAIGKELPVDAGVAAS